MEQVEEGVWGGRQAAAVGDVFFTNSLDLFFSNLKKQQLFIRKPCWTRHGPVEKPQNGLLVTFVGLEGGERTQVSCQRFSKPTN